jgi:NADH:ubiquinone oxidoreductase subunit B-like Fe-S oxidoreductase
MGTISADRKEYIALKASGTCTCCKVELATDGTAECKKCRQEHLGRNERRRNKLMAEGLCSGCLRNKPAPGMKMCASCRILSAAAARKRAAAKAKLNA